MFRSDGRSGDLVVADFDGIVVVQPAVPEIIAAATDKVNRENKSRAELMSGAYLADVYRRYGVLTKRIHS